MEPSIFNTDELHAFVNKMYTLEDNGLFSSFDLEEVNEVLETEGYEDELYSSVDDLKKDWIKYRYLGLLLETL